MKGVKQTMVESVSLVDLIDDYAKVKIECVIRKESKASLPCKE